MKENCKIIEAKYQEASQELEHVKSSSTPRPDWDKCNAVVNEDKWRDLSNNKSSIQILDTLLNELSGKKHSSAVSDFDLGLVSISILTIYHLVKFMKFLKGS